MDSVTYLTAPAVNNLTLVLMAFPDEKSAREFLSSLGLVEHPDSVGCFTDLNDGTPLRNALDEPDDRAARLRNALFQEGHYYGGCGECHILRLKTLPMGAPVVPWDLD